MLARLCAPTFALPGPAIAGALALSFLLAIDFAVVLTRAPQVVA